jgi:hypothetical protein
MIDNDGHVLVASLDLRSAFDLVNVELLLMRMKIIRGPEDVIELVKVWLNDRSYYLSKLGENLCYFHLLLGTVQ